MYRFILLTSALLLSFISMELNWFSLSRSLEKMRAFETATLCLNENREMLEINLLPWQGAIETELLLGPWCISGKFLIDLYHPLISYLTFSIAGLGNNSMHSAKLTIVPSGNFISEIRNATIWITSCWGLIYAIICSEISISTVG